MFRGKPAPGNTCFYCQNDKQVMEITFDGESHSVTVCLKDFWRMFEARVKNSNNSGQHPGKSKQNPSSEGEKK